MELANFIRTGMDKLLEGFGEVALEIAPELSGQDRRVLQDHAREMLESIVEDLMTLQINRESAIKTLAKTRSPISMAGDQHGASPLGQGSTMIQTIQELRAVRAKVFQAWGESQRDFNTDYIHELVRFNQAIDQLIVNSVASYSTLKEQEAHLFEAMLRVSPDPSAIFDRDGKLLFVNTSMAVMANTTAQDAVGKTPLELPLGFATELEEAIAATVISGEFQRREFQYVSPSNQELYFDCQLVPIFSERGEIMAVAQTSRDITERKQNQEEIWRNANFDALTGIPNRRLFLDRLEQSLLEAKRQGRTFALMFIDLDRFKLANDQHGHRVDDRLLKQVADRISTNVRAMDTFARLGGDEFTLIFKDVRRDDAKRAAELLLAILERPFSIDSHKIYISGSIGVALYPDDGQDTDQLMLNADQAMYAAKDGGGHQVRLHQRIR